ncbi:MAG: class I SAM-dependent methyltransferase [Chloroflexi bacterium]|nr:class I SAM-dependent methyltransferase [Chloroflexota bacterium]
MDKANTVREVFDINVPWITDIPTTQVACLLCGERNIVPLNTFVLNSRRFHTVRCRSDGMMWLDPQPTADFYRELYAQHYHLAGPDDPLLEQATLDVHSDQAGLQRVARIRLDEIEQFAAPGHFLEVGFGSCYTLLEAQKRGWDVLGIELSPSCVDEARARGIPAVCAELPAYDGPRQSFDVIGMYSVVEHTHDPPAYLRRAYELLRADGVLVLRLPDTGDEGPPASLIAHLYHFNQCTITELLKRCGFAAVWVGSRTFWRPKKYPGGLWSINIISRKMVRAGEGGG